MIITCNNCNKKFNIDSSLIPEKGRLLQCISCNYKWFFKKEVINKVVPVVKISKPSIELIPFTEKILSKEIKDPNNLEPLDAVIENTSIIKKTPISENVENVDVNEVKVKTYKNKKNYSLLGLIIVFIISFIALIIILDTFQKPISNFIPNIEFLLYSLYETINDIKLFFKDLI